MSRNSAVVLGWICGNLYSRVGIKDWNESEDDKKSASFIRRILLDESNDFGPKFLECPRAFLEGLKKGTINLRNATASEIEAKVAGFPAKTYKEKALDAIEQVLENQGIDFEKRVNIRNNLKNDRAFSDAVRSGKT